MSCDVVACELHTLPSNCEEIEETNFDSNFQGTDDVVYTVANAEQEIKLFTNAPSAELVVVDGGAHFLSASHPKDVDNALIAFVGKYA